MDAQATFSYSFTQSDLGPVVELPSLSQWPAQRLLPQERQELAIQVLAGAEPVSDLAREHEVSRKFLYQQAHTAEDALTQAFDPATKTEDVLFNLPVTKTWLQQLVLALVLIGHSPYRAVVELLRDLFDWHISLGTVHNIVASAVEPARTINRSCNLGGVRIGAHDEIFQASLPVLVGVDTALASRCAFNDAILEFLESFFPRIANDLNQFSRRIVKFALTKFEKHSTVMDRQGRSAHLVSYQLGCV